MRRLAFFTLVFQFAFAATFATAQSQKQFGTKLAEPFALERGSLFEASGRGTAKPAPRTVRLTAEIAEAEDIILQNHFSGRRLLPEQLTKSTLTGALRTLDPHSKFYGRTEWNDFVLEEQSAYTGIGATIGEYQRGEEIATYIVATAAGSAAEKAGLKFGDRITAVNGKSVTGLDSTDVRDLLRGPERSTVSITLERAATLLDETITLRRTSVPQPSIPDQYLLESSVGYISLTEGFTLRTAKEFDAAILALKSQGMKSLILDLRGNGGGIVEKAARVAEHFLARGTLILTQRGRSAMDNRTWRSANPRPETMPLVLLVDEYTASASEIVAGALQDNDRALIVGMRTYGKGLVQSVIELPNARGLTLTSARYLMPSGRSIQRDYFATGLYDYFKHAQKAAAIENAYTEARTVSNRRVTGGDGIAPDEVVDRPDLTARQARLIDPIFFFMRDLANGRVADVTNRSSASAVEAFIAYAARHPEFRATATDVRIESAFVDMRIRYSLAMITGGITDAVRVLNRHDPQTQRAVKLIPAASDLASKSRLLAK